MIRKLDMLATGDKRLPLLYKNYGVVSMGCGLQRFSDGWDCWEVVPIVIEAYGLRCKLGASVAFGSISRLFHPLGERFSSCFMENIL